MFDDSTRIPLLQLLPHILTAHPTGDEYRLACIYHDRLNRAICRLTDAARPDFFQASIQKKVALIEALKHCSIEGCFLRFGFACHLQANAFEALPQAQHCLQAIVAELLEIRRTTSSQSAISHQVCDDLIQLISGHSEVSRLSVQTYSDKTQMISARL